MNYLEKNQQQDGKEGKESSFNSAIATLERVDIILRDCNILSGLAFSDAEGNFNYNTDAISMWRMRLYSLLREIYPKMSSAQQTEIEKMFSGIPPHESIFVNKRTPSGDNRQELDISRFSTIWQGLHLLELKLRTFADSKGMLLPDKQGGEGLLQ